MKLEVGKYYKNRVGNKCQILFQKFNMDFVYIDLKYESIWIVKLFGKHEGDCHSAYDLISEWVEPVKHEVEVAFWKKDGTIRASQDLNYWGTPLAKIKVKFKEGEGL
jgi:hypothetical protein